MLKTIKNLINICVLSFISNNLYANASGDVNYALSIIDGVDRIKKLYSKQNLNNNKKYNGKVKFN